MIALLTTAVALQVSVSPVQKVLQLLGELKSKVEADLANEGQLMDEYTSWCDSEANEKEDAITSSERTLNDLKATIQDATATIGSLTSAIDGLTTKISTSERELDRATGVRNKQHKDFADAEKELVGSVDSLARAHTVLQKNVGFLQSGKVVQAISLYTDGLQKIIDASWVTTHQKQVLQSLVQSESDEPAQATVSAYSSQSSGILDTIQDMQAKAESSLTSTRKDEMEAAHAFAMLKQGLEDEIAVMRKQLSEKTNRRAVSKEELHGAETALTETEAVLAADTKYLEELKQKCQAKALEWSERQKQAGQETAAIQKAKDILSDGVKVLLQTSASTRSVFSASRETIVVALQRAAKASKSYSLAQLAAHAQSDPFGKIRGLVEAMIAKLQKEAAAEADQKAFCDEELGESRKKQKNLSGKVSKSAARIDAAVAKSAKLAEEVQQLEQEVADISAGEAEATKIRHKEHADFLKASSDYKASATAVAKAIEVLTAYYSSAAFVQMSGGPKSGVASAITGILEVAEGDFTRLLAEAEAAESEGQEAYDTLQNENAVSKATKEADAKGKSNGKKQLEVALGNYRENRATTSAELDAVLLYLDKLKPQCATKVMSYATKVARREAEINGLEEALTLLSE